MDLLRGESCAGEVRHLIVKGALPNAVNLAETLDQLVRVFGRRADGVRGDLALLQEAGLEIVAVTEPIAARAGRFRAKHCGSTTCPVSMADCLAAATAQLLGRPLATSDPDLACVARAEGIDIVPLMDTQGNRQALRGG
ncbi:MAG: PIN domain-containing protein [Dermatophilaceae bacterium]